MRGPVTMSDVYVSLFFKSLCARCCHPRRHALARNVLHEQYHVYVRTLRSGIGKEQHRREGVNEASSSALYLMQSHDKASTGGACTDGRLRPLWRVHIPTLLSRQRAFLSQQISCKRTWPMRSKMPTLCFTMPAFTSMRPGLQQTCGSEWAVN